MSLLSARHPLNAAADDVLEEILRSHLLAVKSSRLIIRTASNKSLNDQLKITTGNYATLEAERIVSHNTTECTLSKLKGCLEIKIYLPPQLRPP
ncbi:hypothetical protein ACU8KH_04956 [Lachancea thermotolerans]